MLQLASLSKFSATHLVDSEADHTLCGRPCPQNPTKLQYSRSWRHDPERFPKGIETANCNPCRYKAGLRLTVQRCRTCWKMHSPSDPCPVNERLALPGQFKGYVDLVAHAYRARPADDGTLGNAYRALSRHVDKLFTRLQSKVRVVFQPSGGVNGDYRDAKDMTHKVKDSGILYIDSENNEHPVFDKALNLKFRAVHDYVTHIGGNHAFDARGEIGAYNRHAKLAPPQAKPALFTEVVGQASYYLTFGDFGPQKISTLYGFDYDVLGDVDPRLYARNFEGGQIPEKVQELLSQVAEVSR